MRWRGLVMASLLVVSAALGSAACSSGDAPAIGDPYGTGSGSAVDASPSGEGGATGDATSAADARRDGTAANDASTGTGLVPPAGASSNGSGGPAPVGGATQSAGSVTYRLIVPSSYAGQPTPLLVVFSGTEGGAQMTQNLMALGPSTNTDGFVRAVLDGVDYNGDGQAGAAVLDDVRAKYNIDDDRTYLMGESAGTTAALALGFHLRQSFFAAYWANDVTASDSPAKNAAALGFAPWGQAGPGGDFGDATAIVDAMKSAGYRVPSPAPYAGAGAGSHGSPDQFIAALSWLVGKSRQ